MDITTTNITTHLVVICGPTAIGKSKLSIDLAKHFNSIIISADSRQIYKEMTIGTAIPSVIEQKQAKHYFIHSHSIHDYFNASIYETEVLELLSRYFITNNIAIVTGGSGLYIDAVCDGIDDLPSIDQSIRDKWLTLFEMKGIDFLREEVKKTDPHYYSIADIHNPKRLLKALEVYAQTGKPYSSFLTHKKKARSFLIHKIGLNTDRKTLYAKIDARIDKMMEDGLLKEALSLYPFRDLPSMHAVGYRELFDHFNGNCSLDDAVQQIKNHSHAYARRQITWFRRDKEIMWFEPDQIPEITEYIETCLL